MIGLLYDWVRGSEKEVCELKSSENEEHWRRIRRQNVNKKLSATARTQIAMLCFVLAEGTLVLNFKALRHRSK